MLESRGRGDWNGGWEGNVLKRGGEYIEEEGSNEEE